MNEWERRVGNEEEGAGGRGGERFRRAVAHIEERAGDVLDTAD
jgi:hypothetical protein